MLVQGQTQSSQRMAPGYDGTRQEIYQLQSADYEDVRLWTKVRTEYHVA